MALMVRMSIADIILVDALITKYMQEKNIRNIDDVDEKVIQERYDEIMKLEMWKNPEEFDHIKCPKCRGVSYNTNDIKHKYCGHCHEWHEDMNLEKL